AAAGAADGIIGGSSTAEGAAFRGDKPITFNEAATILDRMLDLGDVDLEVWYADRDAAPSWAAQAVGNMEAVSVLAAGSFGSQSMEKAVTRADAAQMLEAAGILLEGGGKEPRGLFGWLG
ncbi:MAG: surface layer protein, partial [Dysosmobacter sp.]|nr:surface layer protein [Dysosmobacter sp.]